MDKAIDQLERVVIPKELPAVCCELLKDPDLISFLPQGKDERYTPPRTKLVDVLLGISPLSPKTKVKNLTFFDDTLNPSQRDAVRFALESPEIACIHGPPGTSFLLLCCSLLLIIRSFLILLFFFCIGTGKTHTLIEIIRQLTSITPSNSKAQRVLVCGASNLAVDNILERLLALQGGGKKGKEASTLNATRLGHPARVMANADILDATLEARAGRSDQAALVNDVKQELSVALDLLAGKGKGAKGKAPRGLERKKIWEEVRALRKEYRQREGGVVKAVLGESQVRPATLLVAPFKLCSHAERKDRWLLRLVIHPEGASCATTTLMLSLLMRLPRLWKL